MSFKGWIFMEIELLSVLLASIMIANFALAFTIIFLERKNVSSTWAWLMVLFFIPILGFLLYLLFGRRISKHRIFTWDTKSRLGVEKEVNAQLELLKQDNLPDNLGFLKEYRELIAMNLSLSDAIISQNNQVELFTDGKKKFDQLIADMENAEHHIHLLYYIVRDD